MIQAGISRMDITPPLGTTISGYFRARYAKGVLDPLEINALAFGNGEQTAVILSVDVVAITAEYADPIRASIAARLGIPAAQVFLCALHQHTAICLGGRDIFFPVKDPVYLELFARKCVDAAVMAVADMSEARVFTAEARAVQDIAFVRRYWLEDGTLATNPSSKGPAPVRRAEESDNTVRFIRFVREGRADIAYVNFSTHPDVISGSEFSADWQGFVRRFVEADHENVHCIGVTGCQGDSNHIDFMKPKAERFPAGERYAHSRYMGRVIADTVKQLWDAGTEHTGDRIFGACRTVYNKTNTRGEGDFEEAERYVQAFYAGTATKTHISDIAAAVRILDLRKASLYQSVNVSVLGLGDILFVGYGGEPFTRYTHLAHELAGEGKRVFCSCCTNGYAGYMPSAKAFEQGGYEINNTFFTPDLEEQCAAALSELLKIF